MRAGRSIDNIRWEAIPFSGITDASGNALDGNGNNAINNAADEVANENPDNYYWGFNLEDRIEKTPPYLIEIIPGLDAENVLPDQAWQMTFSKRLLADSAYAGVAVVEEPPQDVPLWKVPRMIFNEISNTSTINMKHGVFLDGIRQYYYPIISSGIVDVNFNCFYPGLGPSVKAVSPSVSSPQCAGGGASCCAVNANSPFCCNGEVGADKNSSSTCLDGLIP